MNELSKKEEKEKKETEIAHWVSSLVYYTWLVSYLGRLSARSPTWNGVPNIPENTRRSNGGHPARSGIPKPISLALRYLYYSDSYLSDTKIQANVSAFVDYEIFPPPATFSRITILIFLNDILPCLCLGLNSRLKVAGASL